MVSHYLRTTVFAAWERFLRTIPEDRRDRFKAVLILDCASTHRSLGRTGDVLHSGEANDGASTRNAMTLFFVPPECTKWTSPLDVCGAFKSFKAACRREALRLQNSEPAADYYTDLTRRLRMVFEWGKVYSRIYSIPSSFHECGYSTAEDGGSHLLHSRLRDFLRSRGYYSMVNLYYKGARILRCMARKKERADLSRQLGLPGGISSTDEGDTDEDALVSGSDEEDDKLQLMENRNIFFLLAQL